MPDLVGMLLQINRLSLRNNQLKFKTAGALPIISERSIEEYTSNEWKQKPEDEVQDFRRITDHFIGIYRRIYLQ